MKLASSFLLARTTAKGVGLLLPGESRAALPLSLVRSGGGLAERRGSRGGRGIGVSGRRRTTTGGERELREVGVACGRAPADFACVTVVARCGIDNASTVA